MFSNLKQLSFPLYYEYCFFCHDSRSIHSPDNNTLISFWVTLLPSISAGVSSEGGRTTFLWP